MLQGHAEGQSKHAEAILNQDILLQFHTVFAIVSSGWWPGDVRHPTTATGAVEDIKHWVKL